MHFKKKLFLLNAIDIFPYPQDNYILLFELSQRFTCFLVGMPNNEVCLPLGIVLTLHLSFPDVLSIA